jgi:hypothetical protein
MLSVSSILVDRFVALSLACVVCSFYSCLLQKCVGLFVGLCWKFLLAAIYSVSLHSLNDSSLSIRIMLLVFSLLCKLLDFGVRILLGLHRIWLPGLLASLFRCLDIKCFVL